MKNTHIERIAALLMPDETRMVGGYVRDWVLGLQSQDIDLATTALPETVMEKLTAGGVVCKSTGIAFGTVTAIIDGKPYEITTLREDTACDGRHAEVTYSTSWEQDAARRDFTMNAMSMGLNGRLYDYFGGQADAKAGVLQFVGEAAARIQEDYLRILRLFRFHAYYGKQPIAPETLKACEQNKQGIENLSGERIQKEMLKLLSAPKPAGTLKLMQDCGVLALVLPSVSEKALGAIYALEQLESRYANYAEIFGPADLRRLALFLQPQHLLAITDRWKLSRAFARSLQQLVALLENNHSSESLKSIARKFGKPIAANWLLCLTPSADTEKSFSELQQFDIPQLPLNGQDIMSQFPTLAGKKIGDYLALAEKHWEESGYHMKRDELLAILRRQRAQ